MSRARGGFSERSAFGREWRDGLGKYCVLVLVAVLLSGGGACGGVVVVLGFGRAVGLLFGGDAFGGAGSSRVRYREGNGFVGRWRCMRWCQ